MKDHTQKEAGTQERSTLVRVASPQAWRRLRSSLSIGERNDIARDIAAHIEDPSLSGAIADALSSVVWDARKQG